MFTITHTPTRDKTYFVSNFFNVVSSQLLLASFFIITFAFFLLVVYIVIIILIATINSLLSFARRNCSSRHMCCWQRRNKCSNAATQIMAILLSFHRAFAICCVYLRYLGQCTIVAFTMLDKVSLEESHTAPIDSV